VISKGGAWYKYLDNKFQGKDAIIEFFRNNKEEFDKIKKIVKDRMSKVKIIPEEATNEVEEEVTEEQVIDEQKLIEKAIPQEVLVKEEKEEESRISIVKDQIAQAILEKESKKRTRKPKELIQDPEIVDLSKIDTLKD
jgi:hypothetical protein